MLITSVLKSVTAKQKKTASELLVRELEEVHLGQYIAYVDQDHQSFDVGVTLENKKIKNLACDCDQADKMCVHKLALLLTIEQGGSNLLYPSVDIEEAIVGKNIKNKKSLRTKKLSPSEALLQNLDQQTIAHWLSNVFKKDKSLEQQFLLSFTPVQSVFTPEQVTQLAQKTIASVAGKRKTLEGTKIKKMLDLLDIAYEPIDGFVQINITKPVASEIFYAYLNELYDFDRRVKHYSKRLDTYVEKYIEKFALYIHQIKNQGAGEKLIRKYVSIIFEENYRRVPRYNYILIQQLYLTGTQIQQKQVSLILADFFAKNSSKRYYYIEEFDSFLDVIEQFQHVKYTNR